MKIYHIAVYKPVPSKEAAELVSASELSLFPFFGRSNVGELLKFFSRTLATRTAPNQRQSVQQENYMGHVFASPEGVTGILMTDKEYPVRPAYTLLNMVLLDFLKTYPLSLWANVTSDSPGKFNFPALDNYIKKYQNPSQADALMRVQQELDETKIVLHKTIDNLLSREDNLKELALKSGDLSRASMGLFEQAQKTNLSCCVIM